MPYIVAIYSDVYIQVAIGLVAIAFAMAVCRIPKNPASRKRVLFVLWFVCFGVVAAWIMRQEASVLAGGLVSSAEQPVAVPIKGTVRYVTQTVAFRHEASMFVLLVFGLAFIAAYMLAQVDNRA